jgi:hypothetical protein
MKAIAEITDRRIARKMLEHVGLPTEVPQPWPARGPPESAGSVWIDEERRCPDDEVSSVIAGMESNAE